MLKKRIIPKLQMKSRIIGNDYRLVLVTTINFNDVIEIGDPVSQAKIFQAQMADELIFLDLDARSHNLSTIINVIRKAAEEVFMPFTVGGGIKSIEDFSKLLNNGADKVSINTSAVKDPNLIRTAANYFGSQCVVVSIDYKRSLDGKYYVWVNGGEEKTMIDPIDWALEAESLGAGELLLTSIDKDGTVKGLDNEFTAKLADRVTIPIITAGGCGVAAHFINGFSLGKADAVSAGTYFALKDQNIMQARSQLNNAGIPIRINT